MRERESRPQAPLRKTHDYLYEYRGLWADPARVRVRIYDAAHVRPVVIATEPVDNPGTSVTNMIEYLAAEIIDQHFRGSAYEERTSDLYRALSPTTIRSTTARRVI